MVLQVKNLSVSLIKDNRPLVERFSFVVNEGDKIALIGEEGNGKSTLLKLIYDPELVTHCEYSGEIVKNHLRMGYLPQEFSAQSGSVYDFVLSQEALSALTHNELADLALPLGLEPSFFYAETPVNHLSGGEKVKLMLSAIIATKPDILLLDEPSNDIDTQTLEWLEQFINDAPVPVLYISHDEMLLENTANAIIHIEQLRKKQVPRATFAHLDYREYVDTRLRSISKQAQDAAKEKEEFDKQQEKWRRIFQRVEHEQNVITRQNPAGARLLKKKMKTVKAQGRRFDKQREDLTPFPDFEEAIFPRFDPAVTIPAGKTVLELNIPELTVPNGERVLARDIRLIVKGGEKICIVGKNGAGKSTLLKRIAEILLQRADISAAYIPQDYNSAAGAASNVTAAGFLVRTGDKEELTRVRTFLGSLKYTPQEMDHPFCELSGGQKAKLLLIKTVLDGNNVLLLDEPTRNFSPLSGPAIREMMKRFGGCVIAVSHDRKFVTEVFDRVIIL
jgi:ATPase subunit of ABC transporter with duplicated ATPase domains